MCRVAMVWACCLLGLTAACTTKPQEGGDPPPLASPSPTARPSPTQTALPADPKAALAAIGRAYYLERNRAVRTGDTANLRALAIPNCPCNDFADGIDADWRKGRVESPNFYTIVDVLSPMMDTATDGHVTIFYSKNSYRLVDSGGKVLINLPDQPKTVSSSVRARRIGSGWKVFDVIRLP